MIKFVNQKSPDLDRVSCLLEQCASQNLWANRGPLYTKLADDYSEHFGLGSDCSVTPCANAGIALEAMARLLSLRQGRKLRWVGSAFSFHNLGRGYFADMALVDCTTQGLLDIDAVRKMPEQGFDGIIVVNPFGLFQDFDEYVTYARESGKFLLIDNAAGISRTMPDWPWQALSLHHTKPYGMGEGGLALTPPEAAEDLYGLLNYGPLPNDAACWLNNGKISDIACAFLIDRLEKVSQWEPLYLEQAKRVYRIASDLGLSPIRPFGPTAPAMSWGYLAPNEIPLERIVEARRLTFGKYYKPLADLPQTTSLYSRLVNIPTHPDVSKLSDSELAEEIARLL
ncbi:DegT/DnrJ/EryC1/StrS family aminotransferase [Defluviimonas aestuarii]|uniref:DegT/DnrJ/EryC1/StrS family aminotransferase n=1 Tax=Albidovulum aestuarii TaxID=1130726 RepID=UPI00249A07B2|nr:DegT/DnrJ/EryC1/StrS family aminotransferase [Defluviimonas aestuarii]MDI3336424.1 DegT/DnrJ/EryC1/StrS family aminotransferase [Defluviimonas aestuarii]